MPSPKQTITAIGMIIIECVVWGNIDILQVFGDRAVSLAGKGNECEIMF